MKKLNILAGVLLFCGIMFASLAIGNSSLPDNISIVLTKDNHVLLRDEVNGASVDAALKQFSVLLDKRGNRNTPLYLVLDTPGGSVSDGYRLHEFLKGYQNIHTITINSYSMGAILVELVGGQRLMVETGTLMFHRMRATLPNFATPEQLHSRVRSIESLEQFAMQKTAERVGVDIKELYRLCDEELYMNGPEALKKNFIDKVITLKCSAALMKEKVRKTIQPLPFLPPVEIEVSACPLL